MGGTGPLLAGVAVAAVVFAVSLFYARRWLKAVNGTVWED